MAIAARYAGSDRRVFCLASDGDMNEGSTWEAIMFAAQEKLDNLVLIVDYNQIQALGFSKDIEDLSPLKERMEIFGWAGVDIDGHDVNAVYEALKNVPIQKGKPTVIIARTVKCKGIDYLENTVESHYRFVPDEKLDEVISKL
jgi:transketolase